MWACKALFVTLKGVVGVLAAVGGASVYAVTMLVMGHWGPEQIMKGVAIVEHAQAWIAGLSGGGILAAFVRYGAPVLSQFMSDRSAARQQSLAQQVAEILASKARP